MRDGLRVSTAKIHEWMLKIADDNRMHAAARYLEVNYMIWSGVAGEINRLFECFTVGGDEGLYKVMMTKWLCQCVAMAYNNSGSYGADGVLVLKGPHGFCRRCADRWEQGQTYRINCQLDRRTRRAAPESKGYGVYEKFHNLCL